MRNSGIRATSTEPSWVSYTYEATGVEHKTEKPAGVFRIMVLGDSFMEGASVWLEEIFARRLENLARASEFKIEVISLALSGRGTLDEYLMYDLHGNACQPDFVLLAFFPINDLRENNRELEPKDSPPYLLPGKLKRRADQLAALQENRMGLIHQLAIRQLIRRALHYHDNRNKKPHIAFYEELLEVHQCEEAPAFTRAWQPTERILRRLRDEVTKNDASLIVFSAPAKIDVDPTHRKYVLDRIENSDRFCIEEGAVFTRLKNLLKKLEIEYIDLLPEFEAVHRRKNIHLHGAEDYRWNAAGHHHAARIVWREIQRRELIPSP